MNNSLLRFFGLSVILAGAVAAAHLLPGFDSSHVDASLRNSFHFIGFAVVAAIVFEMAPGNQMRRLMTVFPVVIALGFLSEVIQKRTGNAFDLADIFRDFVGAAVFIVGRLLWLLSSASGRSPGARFVLRLAASLSGLLLFVPLIYWSIALNSYQRRIPLIADFSNVQDKNMLTPIESRISVEHGVGVAMIEVARRGWSGVLVDTVVSDWSGYQYLVLRLKMTGAPETSTRSPPSFRYILFFRSPQ